MHKEDEHQGKGFTGTTGRPRARDTASDGSNLPLKPHMAVLVFSGSQSQRKLKLYMNIGFSGATEGCRIRKIKVLVELDYLDLRRPFDNKCKNSSGFSQA